MQYRREYPGVSDLKANQYLRKQVMDNMSPDIMMNLIEDSIVSV